MIAISTVVAVILSAWLYRLGGFGLSAKPTAHWLWRWAPNWMWNTKARDIGCALVGTAYLMVNIGFGFEVGWKVALAYVVCFGGTFGALTTYWDSVPFNNGQDNFYMHGFMIAFAKILFAVFGAVTWPAFAVSCVGLGLSMGILCAITGNDYVEECGRGGLKQLFKLPLVLIK